jgi:hypothetical protein
MQKGQRVPRAREIMGLPFESLRANGMLYSPPSAPMRRYFVWRR